MYGDSTRPYYLGKYLNRNFIVSQYCNVSKPGEITYHNFFNETFFSKPISIFKATRKVFKEITKKGQPKIIYAHQLLYGLIGILLKRKYPNIILISDFHTSSFFELKEERKTGLKQRVKLFIIPFLENLVVRYSDEIVTVSKETKKLLRLDYPLVEGKIHIIKNATDTEVIYKTVSKNEEKEKFLAVFPNPRDSFISNDLAIEFLFEIAIKTQNINPKIQFVVLGGGQIPKNTPENVLFSGYVENYNEWLNKADVCIATYPSNAVCGGVRNKICDYLAVGKPIIATKESMRGFDDLIDGVHYYECNTIDTFINQINSIYNDPTTHLGLIEEVNLRKSLDYSWENRANELSKLFKKVINV
jgi:glycosyltransferase involved in cell wall biosynthesis